MRRTLALAMIAGCMTMTACAEVESATSTGDGSASTSETRSTKSGGKSGSLKPKATSGERRALAAAKNYLSFTAFSKQGLREQLSSEAGDGYSKSEAAYAVRNVDADWREQAVKAARNYLDTTSFSRDGLVEQLSSDAGDGYTRAQAEYAVDKVY